MQIASGCSIEHSGSLQEGSAFTTYCRFGDEAPMAAGTLVRVHSGREAADTTPVPELTHRYVTAAGASESWRLNPAGDCVRLVDANGGELQRWFVVPTTGFVESETVMIRNTDQTRALLFFPQGADEPVGDVPVGLMRATWVFARDAGEAMPVLKRWGLSNSEEYRHRQFHV